MKQTFWMKFLRKNKYGYSLLLLILTLVIKPANATVKLAALFKDGMVLQQKTKVTIWGTSTTQGFVRIRTSWNHKTYRIKPDKDGHWNTRIKTPEAGGPYEINLDDGDILTIKDVLIGEVWLCSGQSNMEMPLKGWKKSPVRGSEQLIASAGNSNIRLFHVPRAKSDHPLSRCTAVWQSVSDSSVGDFSAVGYLFAKNLQEKLNVPVGIIQAAYGGTKVQAWMDKLSAQKYNQLQLPSDDNSSDQKITKNTPTVLYNAMIHPLVGFTIKGAIWYQGEGNRRKSEVYADWFSAMVHGWRKRWGQGDFPFYYVQIAPFKYDGKGESALLREAQLKAMSMIPHTGMAITLDIGNENNIHPSRKAEVATRLSNIAFAQTYGLTSKDAMGPTYQKMEVSNHSIQLFFNHAGSGLECSGKTLRNFEISGADKVFHPAEAKITGKNTIIVSSPEVSDPVAVRYAFKDWVKGDLFNTEGLPASSFRTDSW